MLIPTSSCCCCWKSTHCTCCETAVLFCTCKPPSTRQPLPAAAAHLQPGAEVSILVNIQLQHVNAFTQLASNLCQTVRTQYASKRNADMRDVTAADGRMHMPGVVHRSAAHRQTCCQYEYCCIRDVPYAAALTSSRRLHGRRTTCVSTHNPAAKGITSSVCVSVSLLLVTPGTAELLRRKQIAATQQDPKQQWQQLQPSA